MYKNIENITVVNKWAFSNIYVNRTLLRPLRYSGPETSMIHTEDVTHVLRREVFWS